MVAVSPDRTLVAVATSEGDGDVPSMIDLWDVATGALVRSLDPGVGRVAALSFSPDGKRLATAVDVHTSEGTIHVFDMPSGTPVATSSTYCFQQLEWSPDSTWVAASGCHMSLAVLRTNGKVWERESRSAMDGAAAQGAPIAASADGKRLHFLVQDGRFESWDVTKHPATLAAKGAAVSWRAAAFRFDGSRFAVADESGTLEVWSTTTGRRQGRFKAGPPEPSGIHSVQLVGDALVVGFGAGRVVLLDAATGKPRAELTSSVPPPPPFALRVVAVDDRSATIASYEGRFGLSVVDPRSGASTSLHPAHTGKALAATTALSFAPGRDGAVRLIEGSAAGEVSVWDVQKRAKVGGWTVADGSTTTLAGGSLMAIEADRVLLGRLDGAPPVSLVSLVAAGANGKEKASPRVGLAFRDDGAYAGPTSTIACLPESSKPEARATVLAEVFRLPRWGFMLIALERVAFCPFAAEFLPESPASAR
jgi:WD40 repeat protein